MEMTKKTANLVTESELARELDVTREAVRQAVAAGRVQPAMTDAKGRKWFDKTRAAAQWAANTARPKKRARIQPPAEGMAPVPARKAADITPVEAKAMRDVAAARMTDLKIKEKEGALVDAVEIGNKWAEHCGTAKTLFLALPVELRLRIPKLTSDDVAVIESRIVEILDTLAAWRPAPGPEGE
jgi:phage terminase Nu1 subunit (DNA packaging protein)